MNQDLIIIRDFSPADDSLIYEFCKSIFLEMGFPVQYLDKSVVEGFNIEWDVFLLAFDEKNSLIGTCGMKRLSQNEALILRMFITPVFRGTGLAQKLFDTIVDRAKSLNYESILLDVVKTNTRAIHFYQKQWMESFQPQIYDRWHWSHPWEEKYVTYFKKDL